ncbi:ABC transporter permease [Streptomyces sp. R44]|uniref:ABC transporter permease n=1 Tax=Streptomyces sp. R44 TaxID=3238633 RepID=A0AB39TAQ1_9ACTN
MSALADARYLARAWRLELRQLSRNRLYWLVATVLPIVFASTAHFMFQGSHRQMPEIALALTAGLMGMWSTTLLGSGGAINRLRQLQVLEPLIATPRTSFLFILPFALATASLGVYSIAATVVWSALLFGAPLTLAHPVLFLVAVPVTVLALGMLGLLLASGFILYPTAQSLANLLEYPVWILSGLFVPVTLLPAVPRAVSALLAPTWGVKAVVGAAVGDGDGVLRAVGMCLLLSACYAGIALILLRRFEWLARSRGSLSLQ